MSASTRAVLDLALLVELDGGLVVRAAGGGPLRFPGGRVEPGESSLAAADRLLRAALSAAPGQPPVGLPVFAGCVEHTVPAQSGREAAGEGEREEAGEADRQGWDEHRRDVLTILYAVALDRGRYATESDLPAGLLLLRPHEIESRATLTVVRPAAVGQAAMAWWSQRWPSWQGRGADDADAWWRSLRKSVHTLRAQLTARREDLRGEAFRDAAVAICALVAIADGRIVPEERAAMVESIHSEPVLADYPPADLERIFDEHLGRLRTDLAAGRQAALDEIRKVRGDVRRSWAVLHFGAIVGRADGYFDPDERRVVQEAAAVLGLRATALAVQAVDE